MPELTTQGALAALAEVIDPIFERPMLELGTLSDVVAEGGVLRASVKVSSPSRAVREAVEAAVRAAAERAGAAKTELSFAVEVPTREVMGDDPIPSVRNVVMVMSGKGGVGKSTTAVNLTLALKAQGARVGLLDADIYGPSIPTMMGVNGQPISKDGVKITPLSRFGVPLMSIGFLLENDKQAIVWRGPMLHGALSQFLKDVEWGELDYLVIDLPPGTGDVALTMAQQLRVTGAVVVTTPQEVALQDVYKTVSMCDKLKIPILGVIENMSFFLDTAGVRHELFGSGGGQKVADFAKAPLLGRIPIEIAVREWGDKGLPIVQAAPDSEVAKTYRAIAEEITAMIARQHFERTGGDRVPAGKGPTRLKIVR